MLWIKALHIIAVVSWFAGLLYLPRLFAYHAECTDQPGRQRFTTMEQRLYKRIMGPSLVAVIVLGMAMLRWHRGGWIMPKLILVVGVVVFHVWCGRQIKRLAQGNGLTARTYRICNEIPTLLLVAITLLVVFKPF